MRRGPGHDVISSAFLSHRISGPEEEADAPLPAIGINSVSAPVRVLSLRLLGTPDIMLGDLHLTFSYRKALALLAYLAITGHRQAREKLTAIFVGEAADDKASAQFRTLLNVLHSQIGEYLLVTRQT